MSDHAKEKTACYFTTSYALIGVLLACAMFTHRLDEVDAFSLLVAFCMAPILAFCGGLLVFGVCLLTGDVGVALLGLICAVGTFFCWHGAWHVLYGKK